MQREQFEANVARIIEYVHAGDAYQVVPSQRWSAPDAGRAVQRSIAGCARSTRRPYMYFLDFEDFQIAGASPGAAADGQRPARRPTRPIAGTRPRGEDDAAIAAELLADEKERAEHVMLVDLGRNDLGRVCENGTVHVERADGGRDLLARDPHRLPGRRARCARRSSAMDALRCVLPAGTLGGAPKVRAMQIIDELEPVKRGALRRRGRLAVLHRRPGHLHPHPHRRGQGRHGPHPGRRRHGRRRQARLRVRGVRGQGGRRR